jgi:nicastrin
MSGLIVNLGTLHTLRKLEQITSHSKQFIFAFFDAEAWGYGGSKRFLHDLYNFTCIEYTDDTKTACARPYYPSLEFQKINPESIEQLLEFKQIGKLANRFPRVSVFSASTAPTPIARKIEVITKEKNQNVTMLPPLEPGRLPPSSMMSFLKVNSKWKSSASVLTDHFGAYQNQYGTKASVFASVYVYEWSFVDTTKVDSMTTRTSICHNCAT